MGGTPRDPPFIDKSFHDSSTIINHDINPYHHPNPDHYHYQPIWAHMILVVYPLVNVYITNWKITMFNGNIHYSYGHVQ